MSVTGHAEVDAEDIVDRGWGELWTEYMDQSAGGHRPSDTVVGVASLAKKDVLYECEIEESQPSVISIMAAILPPTAATIAHLKQAYHAYRHTKDIDRKGAFFSPHCMQICRPEPSYAAATRQEIVQYLRDAQQGNTPIKERSKASTEASDTLNKDSSLYTIRPLGSSEFDFGTDEITRAIGLTILELKRKAVREEWVGMRVDLWDEGTESDLLVKVQYWWRFKELSDGERIMDEKQSMGWRQCLHDIMYLGPKDGSQGADMLEVNK
ncbi:hypothetical protein TUN205_04334 [Pyrenophora tritici-repentis]|nr:hypothetical protein TUN205_04334 [Pyrenophora tritici-repentis]